MIQSLYITSGLILLVSIYLSFALGSFLPLIIGWVLFRICSGLGKSLENQQLILKKLEAIEERLPLPAKPHDIKCIKCDTLYSSALSMCPICGKHYSA